jgi:hypothetical protein
MTRNFFSVTKFFLIAVAVVPAVSKGMNLLMRPYDTLLIPEVHLDRCYELTLWAETGVRPARGYNNDSNLVNPLAIWNPFQDALAMLNGFPDNSPQSLLSNQLNAIADGTRGTFMFDGTLRLDLGAVIGARWYFLPYAWLTAFLPFYRVRLSNVGFIDRTQQKTPADFRVRNLLTGHLTQVIDQLGDGLTLDGWKRTGPGDLNVLVEWMFDFPQRNRPFLKNVDVGGRVGLTFPTGLKQDVDKLMAFPFGYNGAVGIVYGGGLSVTLGDYFKAGFDVQLLSLFGNTRERRIKTDIDQTDLLLLAKTPAYTDYGLIQRFNLFVQAYNIGGVSLLVGYQFLKKGEDHLALNSCDYSSTIANTAISLDEWIVHSAEFNLNYDFSVCQTDPWIIPQASLFARLPFGGKRSIAFTTVGIMLSVDF